MKKQKRMRLRQFIEAQTRRYQLREIAIELFFINNRGYFFNFYKSEHLKAFIDQLKKVQPYMKYVIDRRLAFQQGDYTKKWQCGDISNFNYLMLINKYSGRTYNDINQYPIFPWILSNYTSNTIDLSDSNNYRNLSQPIGALNDERLKKYKESASIIDTSITPYYLFGSHYQVAAHVMQFLIRIEPFSTLSMKFQSGKFDIPDRIFYSIQNQWHNSIEEVGEQRELIPEFYYQPEFLKNASELNFGSNSSGENISEFQLPPWAKSPEEFIEINRQALESTYVSKNLQDWINLIFGVWQFDDAKAHDNLFFYLTYEQNIKLWEKLPFQDQKLTVSQISLFGQTPYQLFTKPHEQRSNIQSLENIYKFGVKQMIKSRSSTSKDQVQFMRLIKLDRQIIFIRKIGQYLCFITDKKCMYKVKYEDLFDEKKDKQWQNFIMQQYIGMEQQDKLKYNGSKINFKNFSPTERIIQTSQSKQTSQQSQASTQIQQNRVFDSSNQFYVNRQLLLACGYNNGQVQIFSLDKLSFQLNLMQGYIKLHKKRCVVVDFSEKYQIACIGCKDNRVTVWSLKELEQQQTNYQSDEKSIHQELNRPQYILYGHESSIRCLKILESSQLVISVDKNGRVLIHSFLTGLFIKDINIECDKQEKIRLMEVDDDGYIIFVTNNNNLIITTIFNGEKQRQILLKRKVISWIQIYQKKNIVNNIKQTDFILFIKIISTTTGQLLLIREYYKLINPKCDPKEITQLIYESKQGGINSFQAYIEEKSLYIIIALQDGTINRIQYLMENGVIFNQQLQEMGFL